MPIISFVRGLAIIVLIFLSFGCNSTQRPFLIRAHAHNDYEHDRPLLDALDHGFCSVEVDLHLVGNNLLVAHDAENVQPGRTLQELYLDPLQHRVQKNKGRVYKGGPEFLLWMDIKSDGLKTYHVVHQVLKQYENMLSVVREGKLTKGAIGVIISGNRVPEIMLAQKVRYAAMDGRLTDLESDVPVHFMPWISDTAEKISQWKGEGPIPQADIEKLSQIVQEAHRRGRKVRLWGTPDEVVVWMALLDAGVDIINADDLGKLSNYLSSRICDSGH